MSCSGSILLIDEDPRLLFTLTLQLKRAGYSIAAVSCTSDALRCLDNYAFRLVIVNAHQKAPDGQSLLSRIHYLFPKLPIIVLTEDTSLETTLMSFRMGATGYLNLPLQVDHLLMCVEKILSPEIVHRVYQRA